MHRLRGCASCGPRRRRRFPGCAAPWWRRAGIGIVQRGVEPRVGRLRRRAGRRQYGERARTRQPRDHGAAAAVSTEGARAFGRLGAGRGRGLRRGEIGAVDHAVVGDVEIDRGPLAERSLRQVGRGGRQRRLQPHHLGLQQRVQRRQRHGRAGDLQLHDDRRYAVLERRAEIALERADRGRVAQLLGQRDHGADPLAVVAKGAGGRLLPAQRDQGAGLAAIEHRGAGVPLRSASAPRSVDGLRPSASW